MSNTRTRCLTASAGTIIGWDYRFGLVNLTPKRRRLQPLLSPPVCGIAHSGLTPIGDDSRLQPTHVVLPVYSVQVGQSRLSAMPSIVGYW